MMDPVARQSGNEIGTGLLHTAFANGIDTSTDLLGLALEPFQVEFGYKSSSDETNPSRSQVKEENGNDNESESSTTRSRVGDETATLEWLQNKRELVARASKTAREKRRKEVELLRQENKRLKSERAQFLTKIEELNASVQGMRETGGFDLHMENELIKAQLEEHKGFIRGLMQMASGMPSTETSKKRLYKQGADYAATHVMSLLVRSVKEKHLWKRATISEKTLKSLGTGGNFGAWYRYVDDIADARNPERRKRRLNIRFDHILPDVDVNDIAKLYWDLWNNKERVTEFATKSHTNCTTMNIDELMHDKIEPSENPLERDKTDESIVTSYVRERFNNTKTEYDWVFVGTKRSQELSKGALHLPITLEAEKSEVAMGDEEIAERVKCQVLARSTTKHHEMPRASANNGKPIHRINALYVEGMVCWDLEKDNMDKDVGRRSRMVAILSIPETFRIGWIGGPDDILSPDGSLTKKFETFLISFVNMLPIHKGKSKKRSRTKKKE